RIRGTFQTALSLRSIFEAQTIAQQAVLIGQMIAEQIDSETLALIESLQPDEVRSLQATQLNEREEGV
ncbi:MAG TPA: hypothetical protein VFN35_03795, partial [Ktedonobacteraceae bacterium]|nr:hypothetical protein [Ktedonobacteraceae bacterium]